MLRSSLGYTHLNHLTVGIGLPDTLAVSVRFCLSWTVCNIQTCDDITLLYDNIGTNRQLCTHIIHRVQIKKASNIEVLAIALLTWVGLVTRSAYTILEVAADWHEPMIPRRITRPSIAHASEQFTRGAAHRHNIAPISHTRPSLRSS